MNDDTLFDVAPLTRYAPVVDPLSAGQRITERNHRAIALGKHPANGLPIDASHTCGQCANLQRIRWRSRNYLKCPCHRLGTSHSEASDMRASWPACPYFQPAEATSL